MRRLQPFLPTLALLGLLTLGGCVCLPVESVTESISEEELRNHVVFLSQPGLRGRSARSWEAGTVRRYLCERLSRYGCKPWAETSSFELDFAFGTNVIGTNVIGVLPGSDPQCADEIVLISAHYDHLPPTWFSGYPGACDNASSVAVLLELAEKLSEASQRPKRPVAFAFFDAEEMGCLGSFAFTCRDDYDDTAVVAAVNLDLLGRNLLDVVENCLIATGTEHYASIENHVAAACGQQHLSFLPIDNNLIGPVGDHVAFTLIDRPVLFFTCGLNKDYHQTTDTAEKIDFEKLKRESAVIEQTLLAIANAEPVWLEPSPAPITAEKTASFATVLNAVRDNAETFQLDPNDIQTLTRHIATIQETDSSRLTRSEWVELQRTHLNDLLHLLDTYSPALGRYGQGFIDFGALYAISPRGLAEVYREAVNHYLQHKPALLGQNQFVYRDNLPITDASWGLTKIDADDYCFGFIDIEVAFDTRLQILSGHSYDLAMQYKLAGFRGSLKKVLDFCLLQKFDDPNGCAAEMFGSFAPAEKKPAANAKYNLHERQHTFRTAVLSAIEQSSDEDAASLDLSPYRDAPFFDADNSDKSWCLFLTPEDVADPSSNKKTSAQRHRQWIQTLNDPSAHVEQRVDAMASLAKRPTPEALNAMAGIVADETLYQIKPHLHLMDHFPLKHHYIIQKILTHKEEKRAKYQGKTLGQIARKTLKEITNKDRVK